MYDLLIKNGYIVDGSGTAPYYADVAISGNKIAAIGENLTGDCERVIDAEGMIVCPGFIDNHTHGDLNVLIDPHAKNELLQGITTEVGGNCGISLAPIHELPDSLVAGLITCSSEEEKAWLLQPMSFSDFMNRLEAAPMGTNLVTYIGQGIVRSAVMGYAEGPANASELEEMKQIIRDGMEAGAVGLSTGLIYPTGSLTGTEELIELCKVVKEYDGNYCTHLRDEHDGIVSALDEALRIGEASGVRVVVSHHKITGVNNVGTSAQTLSMIEQANRAGYETFLDQYPYNAGATTIIAALPQKYVADKNELVVNLQDPAFREKVKNDIIAGDQGGLAASMGGAEGILISHAAARPDYAGKTLLQIGNETGRDAYTVLFDTIIETSGNALAVFFGISESDLVNIMQYSGTMFGTDASHATIYNAFGHPRAFGTFPRILTKYVRDDKVLSIEEMVRKASALPAYVLGLSEKGLLKVGYDADVLVLDLTNMEVLSDYTNPNGGNKGFRYVIVNGTIVVEDDVYTGALAGKLLRVRHR